MAKVSHNLAYNASIEYNDKGDKSKENAKRSFRRYQPKWPEFNQNKVTRITIYRWPIFVKLATL